MRLLLSYPTTRVLIKSALSALLLKAQVHCPGYRLLREQRGGLHSRQALTEWASWHTVHVRSSRQSRVVFVMVPASRLSQWKLRCSITFPEKRQSWIQDPESGTHCVMQASFPGWLAGVGGGFLQCIGIWKVENFPLVVPAYSFVAPRLVD